MESLVRFLIGFLLVHQLAMANCKVIKQLNVHKNEINNGRMGSGSSVNTVGYNLSSSAAQVNFNGTSINDIAAIPMSDINSLTHISERRHLVTSQMRTFVHSVKKKLKKLFYVFNWWGPEIGYCTCLFKYAWHTYPIVPEMTYSVMGRARRMVTGFMQEFYSGFQEAQYKDSNRISGQVAEMTADDYYDYQRTNVIQGPFRRVSDFAGNIPENVPVIYKHPKLNNVVEMLKNLQPKANSTPEPFRIRYARHLQNAMLQYKPKSNNTQQFRIASVDDDEIKTFTNKQQREIAKIMESTEKPAPIIDKVNDGKVFVEGRSSVSTNVQARNNDIARRAYFTGGPPPGLPTFDELPPADYHYYKNGVHHHVHDLRKDKHPPRGGGWLSFNFEDIILQQLGLAPPGKSLAGGPSALKCSKIYAVGVAWRWLQGSLLS